MSKLGGGQVSKLQENVERAYINFNILLTYLSLGQNILGLGRVGFKKD